MVIFARNVDSNEIECFIVHLDEPGVTREKIQNKMPLRPVQNMQLYFQNVRIPANRKLPGVKGFESVAALLAESRIGVAWVAAGIGMGVYDYMIEYLDNREQFGNPIMAFQLIQDKVFRVMTNVQSSLLLCFQAQKMMEEGKSSIGKLAFTKGATTKLIR